MGEGGGLEKLEEKKHYVFPLLVLVNLGGLVACKISNKIYLTSHSFVKF